MGSFRRKTEQTPQGSPSKENNAVNGKSSSTTANNSAKDVNMVDDKSKNCFRNFIHSENKNIFQNFLKSPEKENNNNANHVKKFD